MSMKTSLLNSFRLILMNPFLEKILVLLTMNKDFGTFITKIPPNHYQYKKDTLRKVTRHNINFILDISDIIDWYIYYGFTENSKKRLLENIKEGDVVIDVGANVGEISMRMANIVKNKNGQIYSFEPDTINHQRFLNNIKINNFDIIHLIKKGLGNKKGTYNFSVIDEHNRGMNRITKSDENSNNTLIDVIKLDDYLNDNSILSVNAIKIDVEGFEMNVIKGATNIIQKEMPFLFIELDDNNLCDQNSSAKELVKTLSDVGYEIVNATNNNKINSNHDFTNCHYDIICTNSGN